MSKLGNPGDKPHCIEGNPSKGILGGDNRTDLGRFSAPGNMPVGSVATREYGWKGDDRHHVEGNMGPDALRSAFRGGD